MARLRAGKDSSTAREERAGLSPQLVASTAGSDESLKTPLANCAFDDAGI